MKTIRIGAVVVAAGLVTGLAACSSGDGATGETTLTIWDGGQLTRKTDDGSIADNSFLHQVADRFEAEHEGVKVDIVSTSGDIAADAAQFQAASIAGNGPDIRIGYTGGNTIDYSDFLLDLEGAFSEEVMSDLTGWNTVREGYSEDGALLALPYGGGSYFYVFYNKELADEAGLDLSVPPSTWEELLELGEQALGKTDAVPFWTPNQEGYVGAWVMAALVGGELGPTAFTDMYNGDIDLADPAMAKAYEAYSQLYARGLTNPDAGSIGNADLLPGFIQGNGVFMISGAWENGALEEAVGEGAGVFPIPMLEGAEFPSTIAGGPNVAVSVTNYSENEALAKEFLALLAEPETIDTYVELFQTEPSNSAQADPSVITNYYLKTEAEFVAAAGDEVVYPFDNVMPQSVIDLFYKVNATVYTGQTTPEDAAQQLQDAYDSERG
ncbi:carbohydrate ABC transporter substrate-binding protein [Microbacterium sp. dk485]|uniref:ABC transporter substrate-binding protein n=1 Tax=Microbacterium sp. dk485 TaxID=2560021 RepID=UPI0010742E5B|nr:ABC transporter substrate-binding protein [Microbacterium sp. dk485]TFV81660.1 carbohydrate ABC transporter substrate-binding protein [Microbacterium sp. dk485]